MTTTKTTQFSYYRAPIAVRDKAPLKSITIDESYRYITSDAAKEHTIMLRSIDDKRERAEFKCNNFSFVSFSGVFKTRCEAGLEHYSGLICLDFDHIESPELMKKKIAEDKMFPVLLTFVSPSGDGLKVVVRVDTSPSEHKVAYQKLSAYFKEKYGISADPSGKDVSRACFLPYDPHAILRIEDRPCTFLFSDNDFVVKDTAPTETSTYARVDAIISELETKKIDITDRYDDWMVAGFALAHEFGEGGRSFFHRISQLSTKYKYEETDAKYSNILRTGRGIVGIGSLFHLVKEAGLDIGGHDFTAKNFKTHGAQFAHSAHLEEKAVPKVLENDGDIKSFSTIYDHVENLLPRLLRECCSGGIPTPSAKECDVRMLSSLAVISVALAMPSVSVYGIYAGHKVYTPIYIVLEGPASSKKGQAAPAYLLAEPIHDSLREEHERRMKQYRQEMAEWHACGEMEDEPTRPRRQMFFIPADSTHSALISQIAANGGSGMIMDMELDTMSGAIRSRYGDYSPTLRKAYHHETISMRRRKDDEFIEVKSPRVGLCIAGTPAQVDRFVGDAENGLFSRLLFYVLPLDLSWASPWAPVDSIDIETLFKDLGLRFFEGYYLALIRLSKELCIRFTHKQEETFDHVFGTTKAELYGEEGTNILPTVHRMGLSCYRIAMVLCVLRWIEDGRIMDGCSGRLECDDDSFSAALIISLHLLEHSRYVYTHLQNSIVGLRPKLRSFFDGLPDGAFNPVMYHDIAMSMGIKRRTSDGYIRQLVKKGLIVHKGHCEYDKELNEQ